ncbi:hypothetical protein I4U23_015633 [Adineta vaga]|nr:hypothetical protein I4U23_015633 [Adineta vaga]
MSSTTIPLISTIVLTSNLLTTYLGSIILITGVLGELLNIIVFLSLRTFRESSCAFYLTLSSVLKLIHLLTGLLSRVVISAADVDWTLLSPFYCKLRAYLIEFCSVSSLGLICLAVIDQFFATSPHRRWQQWSHIKIARRLSATLLFFATVTSSPYLVFFELITLPTTGSHACTIINPTFLRYNNDFNLPVLFAPLPVLITIIFALLTYWNVKQIAYRTVPLVRRRLDQQLTTMVLVQTVVNVIAIAPYIILMTIVTHSTLLSNKEINYQIQFGVTTLLCIYYLYCASSFYIYVCTSERFRRQLRHVLFDIYWSQCRRRRVNPAVQIVLPSEQPQIVVHMLA